MRTAVPSPALWTDVRRRVAPSRAPDGARDLLHARDLRARPVDRAGPHVLLEQKAELARLERQSAALTRENQRLAARAEQLRDHAFLERLARQCLGMVKPGETAFVVVPEEGAPRRRPSADPQATDLASNLTSADSATIRYPIRR